jgi:hypothetical protein
MLIGSIADMAGPSALAKPATGRNRRTMDHDFFSAS